MIQDSNTNIIETFNNLSKNNIVKLYLVILLSIHIICIIIVLLTDTNLFFNTSSPDIDWKKIILIILLPYIYIFKKLFS